jgi:DNA helicase-2/ATP-dependent DNA helicase PcrA
VDPIVAEELALLEQVEAVLRRSTGPRPPSEAAVVAELVRIRDLLVSGEESKDRLALEDEWQRYQALLAQLRRSRESAVGVDPDSPYFAHLRLRDERGERDLCLGRATRIEAGVRIVDWRNAPISRVFYRYQQGDEYEEEMGGRLHSGVVCARRTVAIAHARLERVDAPEGSFALDPRAPEGWRRVEHESAHLGGGEGSAVRVYGAHEGRGRRLGTDAAGARRGDKRLPEISALIDPVQFEAIARPDAGVVVVRGSAGSGKTTVALHRIAWLAYADERVDSPATQFLTFSPALCEYVRNVLPALGVRRARVATFEAWGHAQRRRLFPELPREVRDDTPTPARRLKLHPVLARVLEAHVKDTPGERSAEQVIDDWASALTLRDRLVRAFAERAPDAFRGDELERAVDWCRERVDELNALADGDPVVEAALDAEDEALLLRAWQLRVGPLPDRLRRPLRYRHLAIDEAQDFSPLELRLLLECLDERGSATLAGDAQQQVFAESGFRSWQELLAEIGASAAEVETLRVSYRSTEAIVRFAHALLGDLAEEDAPPRATRHGPPVELFEFHDAGACVAFLSDALKELARAEPLASVAVLAASPSAASLYHSGLAQAEVPRLHKVERYDFRFTPGVEVAEIEQAKGLEFDYVVLVDVSEEAFPPTPLARRLLHVGATRAMHQLWLTSIGPPAALVRQAAAS